MVQASAPPRAARIPPEERSELRYALSGFSESWLIPEEDVPESAWHDGCLELLKALLVAWVESTSRHAAVFRDMAIQVRKERPRVGWNPDLCLVEPAPEGAEMLQSMRLWEHAPPRFAFEAVSPGHPFKDYTVIPEKCALSGVAELAVFDPLLAGPRTHGGPWLLQLWRRARDGGFERVHAGDGPVRSDVLGAYLVPDRNARRIRVMDRLDGEGTWLTREERAVEREREAVYREKLAVERERGALQRIAELEAELAKKR